MAAIKRPLLKAAKTIPMIKVVKISLHSNDAGLVKLHASSLILTIMIFNWPYFFLNMTDEEKKIIKKRKITVCPDITQKSTIPQIAEAVGQVCPSWKNMFVESEDELAKIEKALTKKGDYFPLKSDLFRAFELTPLSKVRVVIVGQDPYPQTINLDNTVVPRAMGLSFSVRKGDTIPGSLKNIYKEIKTEYPSFKIPNHGDLTKWAKQGVLMLNMAMTLTPGVSGSHKGIWKPFISRVFEAILDERPNVIVVMWGKDAQEAMDFLTNKSIKLTAAHPSGYSAYKGFFGNNHFREINTHLSKLGEKEIDWQL